MHGDNNTTSLLDQDVTVPEERYGTEELHITNLPICHKRYVIQRSDESTIASDYISVFTDSNIFDISQMELQHNYCSYLESLPIVETVISHSTSVRAVDLVVESALVLYTN
jgi:hypothetical protein